MVLIFVVRKNQTHIITIFSSIGTPLHNTSDIPDAVHQKKHSLNRYLHRRATYDIARVFLGGPVWNNILAKVRTVIFQNTLLYDACL